MFPSTISKILTRKMTEGTAPSVPFSQTPGLGFLPKSRTHAVGPNRARRETMQLRRNDNKEQLKFRAVNLLMHKQFVVALSLMLLAVMAFLAGCNSKPAQPAAGDNKTPAPQSASAMALSAEKERGMSFPDFGFMVKPADYIQNYSDQPIFRLKADFPKEKPEHVPAFVEQIDFKKNPKEYLLAARDYAFEGNLPDWVPYKNHL
jgi:hypothetical protein